MAGIAVVLALSACGSSDSGADALVRVTEVAGTTSSNLVAGGVPGDDGSVALASVDIVVPAADIEGVPASVSDRAEALLAPHFDGIDGAEALRVMRVACFATTLMQSPEAPDLDTAIESAVDSLQGDAAFRDRVAPLATELDAAGASEQWQDQLAATSICLAAPQDSLDG